MSGGDSIKLVYFDIRGRGELIRLVFTAAGHKFEDKRIQFQDWSEEKKETPYGQLPYMVYQGQKYGQSIALATFFAKKFGLLGKTDLDELRVAEVAGIAGDQMDVVVKYRFCKNQEEKADLKKKVITEDHKKYFDIYEGLLKQRGTSGYFVCDKLSMADLAMYDLLECITDLKSDALEGYPLLTKLQGNVASDSKVKAYLANRKKTDM